MKQNKIYLKDAYCRELKTKVLDNTDKGVVLEDIIFYPRGGGQPDDKGVLEYNGKSFTVKKIKGTPDLIYLKTVPELDVDQGDEVLQKIDWDYRYKLMKHHTTLHILSAVVWNRFEAKVTGGKIYPNRARLDFDLDEFGTELAEDLVDEVNRIIQDEHEVSISFVDRKRAENDPELIRTKVNLLPDFIKEIRLVKIGDVDIQADGGLHVNNTGEIGEVKLDETKNKGKDRKRISVTVDV